MRVRLLALIGCGFCFSLWPAPAASTAADVSAAPVCGAPDADRTLEEPPIVVMSKQPPDAAGVPELVMAVHREGDRFCYRYDLDGTTHSVAPTILVKRGERFAIRIVNDIPSASKGERAAAGSIPPCRPMPMATGSPVERYAGYLNHTIDDRYAPMKDVDTNLHLHGFQGPAAEEDIFLSTLSTPMHACEYVVTVPRSQPVGTYFYHPHAHGASDDEVAGQLAGTWIVEPDTPQIDPADDHVIEVRYRYPFVLNNPFAPATGNEFFAAALAHEAGLTAAHPSPVSYDPFDPPPWPLAFPARVGNDVAFDGCNGQAAGVLMSIDGSDAPANLDVPAGRTQLLRLVNATSDDVLVLHLHDAGGKQPLHVVGLDGAPVTGDDARPLAHYLTLDRVVLPPAGRADVLLAVPGGGQVTLTSEHFCEGVFYQLRRNLLHVRGVSGSSASSSSVVSSPATISQTPAARLVAFAREHPSQIRRRALAYTEYVIPGHGKIPPHQAFYITEISRADFNEHPFWPAYARGATVPSNPDIVVKRGTIEEWYLINADDEVHTFHIHQMTFVVERGESGLPLTRDAVWLPIGRTIANARDPDYPLMQPSVTKILLDFRHVPAGTFVFHCHMLFHEDHGMMGIVRVE
ncbi:MAG TPA: multicopper oxidase family protein [Candidatus Acidoferrales bacterium]|nr:multicopper oxidase family protein [Candidatus Acidoferrales bacterium]